MGTAAATAAAVLARRALTCTPAVRIEAVGEDDQVGLGAGLDPDGGAGVAGVPEGTGGEGGVEDAAIGRADIPAQAAAGGTARHALALVMAATASGLRIFRPRHLPPSRIIWAKTARSSAVAKTPAFPATPPMR